MRNLFVLFLFLCGAKSEKLQLDAISFEKDEAEINWEPNICLNVISTFRMQLLYELFLGCRMRLPTHTHKTEKKEGDLRCGCGLRRVSSQKRKEKLVGDKKPFHYPTYQLTAHINSLFLFCFSRQDKKN